MPKKVSKKAIDFNDDWVVELNNPIKIGKSIRTFIKNQGGIMPEELPNPEKSLKELEKENNKKIITID